MNGVVCGNCGERVVPRLWSYEPPFLGAAGYLRTRHICCYCGVCMYETGGGLNPLGKAIVESFVIALALMVPLSVYFAVTRPEPKPVSEVVRNYPGHASLRAPVVPKPTGKKPDREERPNQVAVR